MSIGIPNYFFQIIIPLWIIHEDTKIIKPKVCSLLDLKWSDKIIEY